MQPKVMIVDDDPYIRIAVKEILHAAGIEVLEASDSAACLQALESGFRGLILMDVMMPGKDGWETVRTIVEAGRYEGNVISMLTARDEPDAVLDDLQRYVTDYVTKPFDPDDLVTAVHHYLGLVKPVGASL